MSPVLTIADYVVLGIMLAIPAGIGIYFRFTGGRQKNTEEFLMADKNMSVLPVTFSLMATKMSAITFLGLPAETYFYGSQRMLVDVFLSIGVVITAYCIVPVYFDSKITFMYEYIDKRFGKIMKIATSTLYLFQTILYMPIVIYAPSLALSTITGLSLWSSVVSLTIICTAYSTLGGLKAVLWTDLFQGILMYLTVFLLIIKGSLDYGGFSEVFQTANEGGRLEFFNLDIDPTVRYTFWNSIASGIVKGLFFYGTTFTFVQRLICCGNLKKAQSALLWNIPLYLIFRILSIVTGIVIYAYFHNCDPLQDDKEKITSGDQLVPYFLLRLFKHVPGLPGFCVAGIFSAALSTMSSLLNSLSAVTVEDYVKPYHKCKNLKDSKAALLAKIFAILYGCLSLLLTFIIANTQGIIEITVVVLGLVGAPTLGVFWLGMFTTSANEEGSLFGLFIGFMFNAWLGFGSWYEGYKYPPLELSTAGCISHSKNSSCDTIWDVNSTYVSEVTNITKTYDSSSLDDRATFVLYKISFLWFAPICFLVTVVSGYFASLIIRKWIKQKEINPVNLSPIVRAWLCKSEKSQKEFTEKFLEKNEIIIKKKEVSLNMNSLLQARESAEEHTL